MWAPWSCCWLAASLADSPAASPWCWPHAWPKGWRPAWYSRFQPSSSCAPLHRTNKGEPAASLAWAWCWRPPSDPVSAACWSICLAGVRFFSWSCPFAWPRCGWPTAMCRSRHRAAWRPTAKARRWTGAACCSAAPAPCACSTAWWHCTAAQRLKPHCCWVRPYWRWSFLLPGSGA